MDILVLQHVAVEHPGVLRDFLRADGLAWTTVELDEGEQIPDLERFDLMLVMGGPQDVWEEDRHPWLKAEKAAIRSFVTNLKRPFLGICLGHQLLAEAIGGRVAPARTPEVGVKTITKTAEGEQDPVLSSLPDQMTVLQWHGAEVVALPGDASILARSDACSIQAFSWGAHAYGFQFHVEISASTIGEWAAIPAYARSLEAQMGTSAVDRLRRDVSAGLPQFNKDAREIYNNFRALLPIGAGRPKLVRSSIKEGRQP